MKKNKKEIVMDAARFANFCQKLKMLLWEEGFSGEDKMDKVALEIWDWLKELLLVAHTRGREEERERIKTKINQLHVCHNCGLTANEVKQAILDSLSQINKEEFNSKQKEN